MTQHLTVSRGLYRHRTACGRWVGPDRISGPAGVTCRACKNTDAWREAT